MKKILSLWKNFEESLIKRYPYLKIPVLLLKTIFKYCIVYILASFFLFINYIIILPFFSWLVSISDNALSIAFFEYYFTYYTFLLPAPIIYLILFHNSKFTLHLYILGLFSVFIIKNQFRLFDPNNQIIILSKCLYISFILFIIITFLVLFVIASSNFINLLHGNDLKGFNIIKNRKIVIIANIIIILLVISFHFQLKYYGNIPFHGNKYDYKTYIYEGVINNYYDNKKARYLLLKSLMLNPICLDTWYFLFGNEFRYAIDTLGQENIKVIYVE